MSDSLLRLVLFMMQSTVTPLASYRTFRPSLFYFPSGIFAFVLQSHHFRFISIGFDLLPDVLPDIADVFAFGAGKYAAHGWRQIEDWDLVCFNKIMRHLTTWMFSKEKTDESGKSHLAHAAADLMIMLAREKDVHD